MYNMSMLYKLPPNYDLDALVKKEFSRLKGITYLDHAAATLYAETQINLYTEQLKSNLYGNPHSRNSSSTLSNYEIDIVRERILKYFNTNSNEYDVIFTSGATSSIQLVAQCFMWQCLPLTKNLLGTEEKFAKGIYLYTQDNHTSILGIRESASAFGAEVVSLPMEDFVKLLDDNNSVISNGDVQRNILVAYSGQCNFSGDKYPVSWVDKIHQGCLTNVLELSSQNVNKCELNKAISNKWFALFDAAGLAATSPVDLSHFKPDFVPISFYKIFGFPTGIGCLLVHRRAWDILVKKYFGGGTVEVVESSKLFRIYRKSLHERLEDGTVSYLSIMALQHGFNCLENMCGGINAISTYVFNIANYFYKMLTNYRHYNGAIVAEVYSSQDWTVNTHGPIIGFNLLKADGTYIGYTQVEKVAATFDIHIRTGCFCNPGACQRYLKISSELLMDFFKEGHICGDTKDLIDGRPTGAIRVSFGYMSTYSDADAFLKMVQDCFIESEKNTESTWRDGSIMSDQKDCLATKFVTVTDLFIYPVKSCGGFSVESWYVDSQGLEYDRVWMIITESGKGASPRQFPNMALISPVIKKDMGVMLLTCKGFPTISITLQKSNHDYADVPLCKSTVCMDNILGQDSGQQVSEWLSLVLGQIGLKLVRLIKRDTEELKQKTLSFANKASYLLIHRSSIQSLLQEINKNEKTDSVDENELVKRFRSNIVVEGGKEYEEESWAYIYNQNLNFKVDGKCQRCQMISIESSTGKRTKEPLVTLSSLRGSCMHFGIYLSVEVDNLKKVAITVGMQLKVE